MSEGTLILGEWNGKRIRVNPADSDYVNATDMCQSAGKLWGHYWQNSTTQEFAAALSGSIGIPIDQLILSVSGGSNDSRGTWVHRRVALHLAQWCSPEFSVWVTGKIEQLMTTGRVVLHQEHQEAELMQSGPGLSILRDILTEVKEQREDHRLTVRCCYDTLEALKKAPTRKLESVVESQLIRTEGGIPQVPIGYGDKIDVLQGGRHVVEVKHASDWKHACGQVQRYARQIENATKRIHLFLRPEEHQWSETKRQEMEEHCRESGIRVTWHEWTFEALPERQQMLPLVVDTTIYSQVQQ